MDPPLPPLLPSLPCVFLKEVRRAARRIPEFPDDVGVDHRRLDVGVTEARLDLLSSSERQQSRTVLVTLAGSDMNQVLIALRHPSAQWLAADPTERYSARHCCGAGRRQSSHPRGAEPA